MGKITNEMVEKAFEVAVRFYNQEISLNEAKDILEKVGMNRNSATDYIYNYSSLMKGKRFTRTTNAFATEYYLNKIHKMHGDKGLETALSAILKHIKYYEAKSNSSVGKRKKIYDFYSNKLFKKAEVV
jgi:5-methylcytosine-specific restriction enzyme A